MATDLSWIDKIGHLRPSEIGGAALAIREVSPKEVVVRLAKVVDRTVGDPPSVEDVENLVVMAAETRAILAEGKLGLAPLKSFQIGGKKWGLFCEALDGRSMYEIAKAHVPQSAAFVTLNAGEREALRKSRSFAEQSITENAGQTPAARDPKT
jgi:hypothetical protein